MYLRFRGCPVMLDRVFRQRMVSKDSTCTAAREVSCAVAARAAVCGVRHNSQNFMQWSGNKRTILCQSEHEGIPPRPKNTHIKDNFFIYGNSLYGPASWTHTKGDTSDMPSMQPTEHSRTSPPGSTGSEHIRLYPSCVCLPECSFS